MSNYVKKYLRGSLDPDRPLKLIKYHRDFKKEHPDYFDLSGLLIFCGGQGSGKTLSGVQYVQEVCKAYPKAILCTNTEIKGLPEETVVVEYKGIESLTGLSNGELGVIYYIDEIHLEFNSLESKNIDIEVMVEVSQQRKQRKHIVGTTQVYGRLAKPFREQIKDCVLCSNYFGFLQINVLIDGTKSVEKDGKLCTETVKRFIWFHYPELYNSYDTYAKMKRYRKEWRGRSERRNDLL